MKKTVLTFGLISGHSMALGYTIMVAAFLLISCGQITRTA